MERIEVRETIAGVILRGIVATCGVEKVFSILCEIEAEEKAVVPSLSFVMETESEWRERLSLPFIEEKEMENLYAEQNHLESVEMPSLPEKEEKEESVIVLYGKKEYDATYGKPGIARQYIMEYVNSHKAPITQANLHNYLTKRKKAKWSSWTTALAVKSLAQQGKIAMWLHGRDITIAPSGTLPTDENAVKPVVAKRSNLWRENDYQVSQLVPARDAILKELSHTPTPKSAFLRETAKKYGFSFGPIWGAAAMLLKEGEIEQENAKGSGRNYTIKKASITETPAPSPLKEAITTIEKMKPANKVQAEAEKAKEIILFHLNRHREEGLPKEHLVGFCLLDNISNFGARMALASLTDEKAIRIAMASHNGVNVQFAYLCGGKEEA
jgi:hypothetical protein